MRKEDDHEYREATIAKVEEEENGWYVTFDDHWSLYLPNRGIVPRVGDTCRQYGKGIGYAVRGVDINGQEVYYRTPEEQKLKEQREREGWELTRRRAWEEKRDELELRWAALPEVFQHRRARFAGHNPDFWLHEEYELFTCEEAHALALALGSTKAVEAFHKMEWKAQKERLLTLSDDHSGNTFWMATRLAYLFLDGDGGGVLTEHGALCPLMGCEEYGCVPRRSKT